jgi:hypothetical protein
MVERMTEHRLMETIAREVMEGQTREIMDYVAPENDGMLAPWMMALDRAQRLVGTIQRVCDAISARPSVGNAALRASAASAWEPAPEHETETDAAHKEIR